MASKEARLNSAYNAEEPLKILIGRPKKCAYIAALAGFPVTETQLVLIAYRLVAKTGQYMEDNYAWRDLEDTSKNCNICKTYQAHFIDVQ